MLLVSWGHLHSKAIYFTEGPRGSGQLSGPQSVTTSVSLQPEYTWPKDQGYIHFRLSNKLETLKIAVLTQIVTNAHWKYHHCSNLCCRKLTLSIPLPTRKEGGGDRLQCVQIPSKPLLDLLQFCACSPTTGSYGHSCCDQKNTCMTNPVAALWNEYLLPLCFSFAPANVASLFTLFCCVNWDYTVSPSFLWFLELTSSYRWWLFSGSHFCLPSCS